MRGQRQVRRAGVVSAGTLALALTGAASPAAADDGGEESCKAGEGLLSTVTGLVCDTTGAVTDTTTDTLDGVTGGATKDLNDGVKEVTDSVNDTLGGATRNNERGTDGRREPSSAPDGDSSPDEPSDSGGSAGSDSQGAGDDGREDGRGDEDSRGDALLAAGSPAGTRGQDLLAGGTSPLLQPLSPLAGMDSEDAPDSASTARQPKLPKIAPSPSPHPEPTPDVTQYVAPTGEEQSFDRGEATPALMVIFAIIAAGVVTGGHVAVARARVRSRRVD